MAALNAAIRGKRFTQVKLLLDIGIDVNKRDSEMKTALMQACFLEDEVKAAKYTKILLERGAKIGLQDRNGLTALSHACKMGREQLVSTMLEEATDFDLNAQDKQGNTALHYAAMSGNFVVLNLILNKLKRYKLNVDKLNKNGETPLIVASRTGNFFCSRILVSEGKASKEARDYVEFKTAEEWGRTKESLRSASKSPLFRVMQLPPRSSIDSQKRESLGDHSSKQNNFQRPYTAPGDLLGQGREKNHRENLRALFRVYEGHVSSAFRRGVKPRQVVISESLANLTEGASQDSGLGDDTCELPSSRSVSPISCQVTRRFSINRASKLAVNTNVAFRRASIATAQAATTGKPAQRRSSQSFVAGGRRLSQGVTPSPRIRRGSMNVMAKITKLSVPVLNVNNEKTDSKDNVSDTDTCSISFPENAPRVSFTPDRLMAKLHTLAEESNSEEEDDDVDGMLQRSSPAKLFAQL